MNWLNLVRKNDSMIEIFFPLEQQMILEFYMSNNNNQSINFQSNVFFVNGSHIKDNFTDIDLVGTFLVPSFYD